MRILITQYVQYTIFLLIHNCDFCKNLAYGQDCYIFFLSLGIIKHKVYGMQLCVLFFCIGDGMEVFHGII